MNVVFFYLAQWEDKVAENEDLVIGFFPIRLVSENKYLISPYGFDLWYNYKQGKFYLASSGLVKSIEISERLSTEPFGYYFREIKYENFERLPLFIKRELWKSKSNIYKRRFSDVIFYTKIETITKYLLDNKNVVNDLSKILYLLKKYEFTL